jgi:hypothetical protein
MRAIVSIFTSQVRQWSLPRQIEGLASLDDVKDV